MFPKPMALPAAAKMTPSLELKPEFFFSSIGCYFEIWRKVTIFF
jgi:hypothetical protein